MFGNFGNFGNNIIDRMFRKVDNMVWDMTSGTVGILEGNDIITINIGEIKDGKADDAQVVINPIADFSFPVPAFAQSVKPEEIKISDLICSDKKVLGWVISIKDDPTVKNRYEILKKDGTITRWGPPSVKILGFDTGVLVLRSLFNMLPNGKDGVSSFSGNIMQMMMMSQMFGGDSDDVSQMIPMMLMTQMGFGGASPDSSNNMMNPMMMAMAMKGVMGGNRNNSGNSGGGFSGGSSGGFFNPPGRR